MRVQRKRANKKRPLRIGVFDSGVGGITVLQALQREAVRSLPASSLKSIEFVYLGDTAHVPYGGRSPRQIRSLSEACARRLKKEKIHALVVACNTASSWAMPQIQKIMGKVPVLGVIEPGIKASLEALGEALGDALRDTLGEASAPSRVLPLLVLATRATVKSKSYLKLFETELLKSDLSRLNILIEQQACPLLVPMIEEGWAENSDLRPLLSATIEVYVRPYRERYPEGGVAVLACTHYPWIKELVETQLPGWRVIDSAQSVAERLFRFLNEGERAQSVSKRASKAGSGAGKISTQWIFTDPDVVPEFARQVTSLGSN